MNELDIIKPLGQSGVAVIALVILGRVVWRVGERMIAAIDRVTSKLDEHTVADTRALGDLRQDIAVLSSRVDAAIEWQERTPVGGPPTPQQARRPGLYSLRPGTKNGDER